MISSQDFVTRIDLNILRFGSRIFSSLRGNIYISINWLKFIYDPINNSLSPEVTLINQFARYLGDRYIKFTEVSRTDLGT